jgi:hypothetical protein
MGSLITSCVVLYAVYAAPVFGGRQPAPAPADGDIRAVYQELRDQTELVLTLQPHMADGAAAPAGFALTLSRVATGRDPWAPASSTSVIDVRAYPGTAWTAKPDVSFDIDGAHVQVTAPIRDSLLVTGPDPAYLSSYMTVRLLERIAAGKHVAANALGLQFDLTPDQRTAVRTFVDRVKAKDQSQNRSQTQSK